MSYLQERRDLKVKVDKTIIRIPLLNNSGGAQMSQQRMLVKAIVQPKVNRRTLESVNTGGIMATPRQTPNKGNKGCGCSRPSTR